MTDDTAPRVPLTRKTKLFAACALLVAGGAFAFLAFGGLGENLVYYWGPKELHAAGDKAIGATIRLGGQVAPGSIAFDPGATTLAFAVTDGVQQVKVKGSGIPPQMFRENIGVVVEGTMTRAGVFESNRVMVSHDNEYRAPKAGEAVDTEALIRSTEGMTP